MKKIKQHKGKFVIANIVLCLLLLGALDARASWDPIVFQTMFRKPAEPNTNWDESEIKEKFSEFLYPFESFVDEPVLPPETFEFRYPKAIVSKQQSLKDIDYLFQVLKYGYACYEYFGGDEVFLQARDAMVQELEEQFSRRFTVDTFIDLLVRHLDFINDGHFQIAHQSLRQRQSMYMNYEKKFFRDSEGYYLTTNNVVEYIKYINGQNPTQYLHPSLNEEGEIIYRIGLLEYQDTEEILIELTLESDNSTRTMDLELSQFSNANVGGTNYERTSIDGIPVVALRSFNYPEDIEEFVRDAKTLKNEDAIIIDFRSNIGGSGLHNREWLDAFFSGSYEMPPFVAARLNTATVFNLGLNYWPHVIEDFNEKILVDYTEQFQSFERGWPEIGFTGSTAQISSKVNVVVLMDSRTGSAAETLITLLREAENVVLLGTNSAGATLIANPVPFSLPHSFVGVTIGGIIRMEVDLDSKSFINREGVGYLPDYWVDPDKALELAVKFIKNYGVIQ